MAEDYVNEVKFNSLLLCPKIHRKKSKEMVRGEIEIKRILKRKKEKGKI